MLMKEGGFYDGFWGKQKIIVTSMNGFKLFLRRKIFSPLK